MSEVFLLKVLITCQKDQIDSTGHFIQIEEKLYQPKNYTRTELENNNYNIWQGNEVPVQ